MPSRQRSHRHSGHRVPDPGLRPGLGRGGAGRRAPDYDKAFGVHPHRCRDPSGGRHDNARELGRPEGVRSESGHGVQGLVRSGLCLHGVRPDMVRRLLRQRRERVCDHIRVSPGGGFVLGQVSLPSFHGFMDLRGRQGRLRVAPDQTDVERHVYRGVLSRLAHLR